MSVNAGDERDARLNPGSERFPGGGNGNPLRIHAWSISWTEDDSNFQFSVPVVQCWYKGKQFSFYINLAIITYYIQKCFGYSLKFLTEETCYL